MVFLRLNIGSQPNESDLEGSPTMSPPFSTKIRVNVLYLDFVQVRQPLKLDVNIRSKVYTRK